MINDRRAVQRQTVDDLPCAASRRKAQSVPDMTDPDTSVRISGPGVYGRPLLQTLRKERKENGRTEKTRRGDHGDG